MNVGRVFPVSQEDPVDAVREFLSAFWQQNGLGAMLVPSAAGQEGRVQAEIMESREALSRADPLAPVIGGNAVGLLGELAADHAMVQTVAVLRPCELRALVELRKRGRTPASLDAITMIGVDCPSCYPREAYRQRAVERGVPWVMSEALTHAAEGGLTPETLRRACQLCDRPAPVGADVVIGVLGVDINRDLLLIARDEGTDQRLGLAEIAPVLAPEDVLVRREVAVAAISEKRARQRDRLYASLPILLAELGSALSPFVNCSLCGDCLEACPLYDGELADLIGATGRPQARRPLLGELIQIARWLCSCSGCGICEDVCPNDVPVMTLVSTLSHRLQEGLKYRAGDPAQPLPWAFH
jgi:formate dehydrogenase subunit beta